jgi:hypothetical protein
MRITSEPEGKARGRPLQGEPSVDESGLMRPESKAKVEVLLKEYDSLRQEVISRLNNRFNLLGYAGAIFTYAVFQGAGVADWRWRCAAGAALTLLLVWLWGAKKIRELSLRIAAIEKKINNLSGDSLLAWETGQRARLWLGNASVAEGNTLMDVLAELVPEIRALIGRKKGP